MKSSFLILLILLGTGSAFSQTDPVDKNGVAIGGYDPVASVAVATAGNYLGGVLTYLVGIAGGSWLIEKVLREAPQTARCYMGSVIWQAGELDEQIKDGVWAVVQPDSEMIFSRNPGDLWEALQHKARQLTALLTVPRLGGSSALQ